MNESRFRLVIALVVGAMVLGVLAYFRISRPQAGDASKRLPSFEVIAQNITVPAGSARPVIFAFSAGEPAARVIVRYPDTTDALVAVCGLGSPDDPVPQKPDPACLPEVGNGVRESIVRTDKLGAIAIWVRRGPSIVAAIHLEYTDGGRNVQVRLPLIPAPAAHRDCRDNACAPFFEILPVHGGAFTARATWQGGDARLALLEGRILGRSFTATGVPYATPAERVGSSPLSLSAGLSAPAEYALVLGGATPLTDVRIDARWP